MVDLLSGHRDHDASQDKSIVQEFLRLFDGDTTDDRPSSKVFLIGSTNAVEKVDEAVRSRFGQCEVLCCAALLMRVWQPCSFLSQTTMHAADSLLPTSMRER